MKKVKINLRRGRRSWSFMLYDSPETAYVLKEDHSELDEMQGYCKLVTLKPGQFMEVEWMGVEYIYDSEHVRDNDVVEKYEKVRLGKVTATKSQTAGVPSFLEIYSGWIFGGTICWQDAMQDDIRITALNGTGQSKMDFSKLFKRVPEGEEEQQSTPSVLH